MPTYDYACRACGPFDALRAMAERDAPAVCPDCAAPSPRVLGAAPHLMVLGSNQRRALDTNERAAHAPRLSRDNDPYRRLKHPAGCGCCASNGRGATVTSADGAKGFPSKRPWMISH
ncbi:MAG: zinc ribbon domain-containing protein [Rubrivivax sp.]|nr:zinc ribbon domain-containing protein [Rubrivivax sp.]